MTQAPASISRRNLYLGCAGAGIFPYLINGYVNSKIAASPAAYWTFEFLCWVAIPLAVFAVLVRHGGLRAADLGLHGRIFGCNQVGLVIAACIFFCPLDYLLYSQVFGHLRELISGDGLFQYKTVMPQSGAGRTLVALYFGLSAGVVEELYFRGLLHRLGAFFPASDLLYLLFSPLLFAAVHWENGAANTIAAYVFGLFSAAAFLLMRNLWPLIIGHIFTDYHWFA